MVSPMVSSVARSVPSPRRRSRRGAGAAAPTPLDAMYGSVPAAQGLYRGEDEHDSCGVAFVVHMKGQRSHDIVQMGLKSLCNLDHRGARGAEPDTGDGAGITIQMPDQFFREILPFDLPPVGAYVGGMLFFPTDQAQADSAVAKIQRIVEAEGMKVLGWRYMVVDPTLVGPSARAVMPQFRQLFLAGVDPYLKDMALERRAFVVRKRIENEVPGVYVPSLSYRTMVYKGMLTPDQLQPFFPDLSDPRVESAIALVHSRFSTNTFPSWPLAHPYRYLAHNGEINTVQGNRNWMRAREALLKSEVIPGDLERLFPIIQPGGSDTASFDNVLELLHLGGRSLPHAILMMIPEAWENHASMSPERRAFYQYHSAMMEPWDGPADIAFTDGSLIGAVLDRNGLRPSRIWVTSDDLVVMASEFGVLDIPHSKVVKNAAAAGPHVPRRHGEGPHRRRRRDQARSRLRAPLSGLAPRRPAPHRRPARARPRGVGARVGAAPSADLRVHAGGPQAARHADGEDGPGGAGLDGHRHAHRRAERPTAPAVRLLLAALRAGDQPAARRDP